jgi:DNA polymerase-3 subunit chi
MRVEFINLRQAGQGLMQAVARLAAWHHGQGRRVLILAGDELQAQEADRALWAFDPASFLPHALAGGPDQAEEPVLIALSAANLNRAQVLITLAPLAADAKEIRHFELLVDFVPVEEGPELLAARQRYKLWQGVAGVDLVHTTRLPG